YIYIRCYFFSSRRRHTRSKRDWSSDVCSSDLSLVPLNKVRNINLGEFIHRDNTGYTVRFTGALLQLLLQFTHCVIAGRYNTDVRSEERRVGKECRYM